MTGLDWLFAAWCALAAALLCGWLDIPDLLTRHAARLPTWARHGRLTDHTDGDTP